MVGPTENLKTLNNAIYSTFPLISHPGFLACAKGGLPCHFQFLLGSTENDKKCTMDGVRCIHSKCKHQEIFERMKGFEFSLCSYGRQNILECHWVRNDCLKDHEGECPFNRNNSNYRYAGLEDDMALREHMYGEVAECQGNIESHRFAEYILGVEMLDEDFPVRKIRETSLKEVMMTTREQHENRWKPTTSEGQGSSWYSQQGRARPTEEDLHGPTSTTRRPTRPPDRNPRTAQQPRAPEVQQGRLTQQPPTAQQPRAPEVQQGPRSRPTAQPFMEQRQQSRSPGGQQGRPTAQPFMEQRQQSRSPGGQQGRPTAQPFMEQRQQSRAPGGQQGRPTQQPPTAQQPRASEVQQGRPTHQPPTAQQPRASEVQQGRPTHQPPTAQQEQPRRSLLQEWSTGDGHASMDFIDRGTHTNGILNTFRHIQMSCTSCEEPILSFLTNV
jgi:hypothetical protein